MVVLVNGHPYKRSPVTGLWYAGFYFRLRGVD